MCLFSLSSYVTLRMDTNFEWQHAMGHLIDMMERLCVVTGFAVRTVGPRQTDLFLKFRIAKTFLVLQLFLLQCRKTF